MVAFLIESHLQAYFSQGFIPDQERAAGAIRQLVQWTDKYRDTVADRNFDELLQMELSDRDAELWSVTLTGGLDSRFLLAILEQSVPAERITRYTWGPPTSSDVIGAKRAAGKKPHYILDTTSVEWDAEKIVAYLRSIRPFIGSNMPRLDAVWLFKNIGDVMPDRSTAVNGFLGDMLSGSHLHDYVWHLPAPDAVARLNRTGIDTPFNASDLYRQFAAENSELLAEATAATTFIEFDLFDYAFRQHQRILPVMLVDGKKWISPFYSPKVIAKWASTPLEERKGQSLYRRKLAERVGLTYLPGKRTFLQKVATRALRYVRSKPTQMNNLADPTKNASLRETMRDCCIALDARNAVGISLSRRFDRMLKSPNQSDWVACMMGMSAELHLRSG
jgi:hypothetical protein